MSLKLVCISLASSLLANAAVVRRDDSRLALPTWKCTTAGGCVQQNTAVVLDKTASADYASRGVTTSGSALTLQQFVNGNSGSPRVYLLGEDGQYVLTHLLNQEISFDVDYSAAPCGENGALYLVEMDVNGGGAAGGAAAGQGYCDAQCPAGNCCNEMDVLEANARATVMTPHPCIGNSCDSSGCGYNPYANGQQSLWAPGGTVDTSRPFRVVTHFFGSDTLQQITQSYLQDGKWTGGGTISSCNEAFGGIIGMGQALARGMVLAMSIWNDASQQMAWLDSGNNGPCTTAESTPANIQAQYPNSHVVFSNIRWGDIGST
ncbi:glycoside hydrolase family 7 protein [Hypoxylon sp. NC1633]|nr:glycoside hydrolase family 7 protein [Hypoxylon sp. NC1633]